MIGLNQDTSIENKKTYSHFKCITGTLLFGMIATCIVLFLIWRAKFGLADIDECYYISLPFRLFQGDSMMKEEWGIIQLSSFLLYPFVTLYMLIFKTTDGIILAFRYLYVFVSAMTSCWIYIRIKKVNWYAAVVASISLLLYTPFGINALSYNSMGILLLAVVFVTLATLDNITLCPCYFLGIVFAGAILCCPFLMIPLVLYSIAIFIISIIIKKKGVSEKIKYFIKENTIVLRGFYLGGATLGVLFGGFVLSRADISGIIASLPYILNDGAHPVSFFDKFSLYFQSMWDSYHACLPILGLKILIATMMVIKKDRRVQRIGLELLIIFTFMSEMIIWKSIHYINFIFMPVNTLAVLCVIVFYRQKKIRKIFELCFIPGVIYSICLHFSSNQTSYAISSAMVVSAMGSIVIIFLACRDAVRRDNDSRKVILGCCISLLLAGLLLQEIEIRYTNVFWDTDIRTQTEYVDIGPEKGLYVSESKAAEYQKVYELAERITTKYKLKDVLYVTQSYQTLYYLMGDVRLAAPSSWNVYLADRMDAYYKINPQKKPELIYVSKECDDDFIKDILETYKVEEENEKEVIYVRK